MFHTLNYGKGLMGSHASQLSKEERWKCVMWVQELQRVAMKSAAPMPAAPTADATKPAAKK